jgi:hypothetical protein
MNQLKTLIDQQYAAQVNVLELFDKANAAWIQLFPTLPEYLDTALKMSRIFSDTAQEAMTEWAKQTSGISKKY